MTEAEYRAQYELIEQGAELGVMTWRQALAKVALLSIDYGRAQAERSEKESDKG